MTNPCFLQSFTLSKVRPKRTRTTKFSTLCCCRQSVSRREIMRLATVASATLLPFLGDSPQHAAIAKEAESEASQVVEEKPVSDIDPSTDEPVITDRVYFDFEISGDRNGGGPATKQRIVIGLYGDLMPRVVENFKMLVAAESNGYSNTNVYRIVPGLTIQLGDVLSNKGKSGQCALATDGESFLPDNFRVKHTIPGIVSMVRRPDGSVDSRFFIATREGDSMYLDGRYAGFGRVVEGEWTLKAVERAGGEGFIKRPVRIISCGLVL